MLVVGLTGGIGSGKSTVAKLLEKYNIPVYYSDDRAKYLMSNSEEIKSKLISKFGKETYNDKGLNRAYLAEIVFNDKHKLSVLNSIVHPIVADDFKNWLELLNSEIVVKENAILFESGGDKDCDVNVNISSDLEQRISRVVKRDKVTRNQVLARINNQWTDSMRNDKSDIVIENDNFEDLENKVKMLVDELILKSKKEA